MRLNPPRSAGRQAGFALVAAMFVMIIIAMVVIAMARLAGNQHGSNSLAIQQTRAYQAARAGLEWAISQADRRQCAATRTLSLAGSNLAEFDGVVVTCTVQSYSEEGRTVNIYRLNALAQNGTPGARPDYAFRRLTAVVER